LEQLFAHQEEEEEEEEEEGECISLIEICLVT